jgi:dTDP-4-dehydrorhamnose 3,5-epimerase
MKWTDLKLPGARLVETAPFCDARGVFEVFWEPADLGAAGIAFRPESACHSYNAKAGTLRGLHYQKLPHGQSKLVVCVSGRVWDVIVDLREESPTYRKWEATELSAASGRVLYIPAGIAHGFVTIEDHSTVGYLIEGAYQPDAGGVVRWDDPTLAIPWPVRDPILSEKDRNAPLLGE